MDAFETIRTRRSMRKYKEGTVDKKKLLRVLEVARLAPSAINRQSYGIRN